MFATKSYLYLLSLLLTTSAVAPVRAQLTISLCTEKNFRGVCTPFTVPNSTCVATGAAGTDVSSVILSETLTSPSVCRICELVSSIHHTSAAYLLKFLIDRTPAMEHAYLFPHPSQRLVPMS